jgi:hypothetical protein
VSDLVYNLDQPTLLAGSESPDGVPMPLTGFTLVGASLLIDKATSEPDEWDEIAITATNNNAGSKILDISIGAQDVAHTFSVTIPATTTVLAMTYILRGGNNTWVYSAAGANDIVVTVKKYRYKGFPRASNT